MVSKGSWEDAASASQARWSSLVAGAHQTNTQALAQKILFSGQDNGGPKLISAGQKQASDDANRESPFGRLMDILTTPLAAVAGAAHSAWGTAAVVGNDIGQGNYGDILQDVKENDDILAPFKGAAGNLYSAVTGDPNDAGKYSMDKNVQQFADQLSTAKGGEEPNKANVSAHIAKEGNVDTGVAGGLAGLALNIGLDPLTYVGLPAGTVAKIAGGLGMKVGAKAAEEVPVATKAIEAATEGVVPDAQKAITAGSDIQRASANGLNTGVEKSGQQTLFSKDLEGLKGEKVKPVGAAEELSTPEIDVNQPSMFGPKIGAPAKNALPITDLAKPVSARVSDALSEIAAKAGLPEIRTAGRDVAAIRSLPVPPVAETVAKAAPDIEKSIKATLEDIGADGPKTMVILPNGRDASFNTKSISDALRTGKIPPGLKGVKVTNSAGNSVPVESLVSDLAKTRATSPVVSVTPPVASKGAQAGVREWETQARAAGLSTKEINAVKNSPDGKAAIESIAKAEEAKISSTAASGVNPAVKTVEDADKITPTPEQTLATGDAAIIHNATKEVATQAIQDLATESPRAAKAVEDIAAKRVNNIKADLRRAPDEVEAEAQRAALNQTHSVPSPRGVSRFNPVHQRRMLSDIARNDAVVKFAISKPMTEANRLAKAGRIYKMLVAGEELVGHLGYPPMTFVGGANRAFRLSGMLRAIATDIGTTTEDLIVRMGLTTTGVAPADKALIDLIDSSINKGRNAGLLALAKQQDKFPEFSRYFTDAVAVQAHIDAEAVPEVVSAVAQTLDLVEGEAGKLVRSDPAEAYLMGKTIPDMVSEEVGARGGSQAAANEATTQLNHGVRNPPDNPVPESMGKRAGESTHKSDTGDASVNQQGSVLDTINDDLGYTDAATKIEGTWPRLLHWLVASHGYNDLYNIYSQNFQGAQWLKSMGGSYVKTLKDSDLERDAVKSLWGVFRGEKTALIEGEAQTVQFIENRLGSMLNDAAVPARFNMGETVANRAGLTMHDINSQLSKMKSDFQFVPKGKDGIEWKNSWKGYTGDKDPLELTFQIEAAINRATARKAVFADLHENFGRLTGPGRIKVGGVPELAHSTFDPEIAKQIPFLMKKMDEAMEPDGVFGKGVDRFLASWKTGVTIYSPAHHIRNLIGDLFFAWLADVPVASPTLINRAFKVMRAKKEFYSDIKPDANPTDLLASRLLNGSVDKDMLATPVDAHDVLFSVSGRGKSVRITPDQIHQAMDIRGLLPRAHDLEDIGAESFATLAARKNKPLKALFSPTGGRVSAKARKVSETREHSVRIMHFIDKFEKGLQKNLNKGMETQRAIKLAADDAGSSVRKWHPDGRGLTEGERKVARRVMPFYSWTRKAIPLMAESLLTHPGRMTLYPKLQFGLSNTLGMNNQDLANPWPIDAMIPRWIREMPIGPLGGSGGDLNVINPSNPFTDLGNQFVNDPLSGAAGMLNPLIKAPVEMITNKSLTTGAPIVGDTSTDPAGDRAQYLDSQVGPLSMFNRLFNTDVGLGSVTSVAQGGSPVPTNKIGDTDGYLNPVNIANFLAAPGIMNTNRYQKSAQYEEKQRQTIQAKKDKENLLKAGG